MANVPEIFVPEAALCGTGWTSEAAAVGETFLHPIPGINVDSSVDLVGEAEGETVLLPLPVYEVAIVLTVVEAEGNMVLLSLPVYEAAKVLSVPEPSQLELDLTEEEEEEIEDQLLVLADESAPEYVTVRDEVTKVTEGAGIEETERILLGLPDTVGTGTGAEVFSSFS
jgi:hypothetical protein